MAFDAATIRQDFPILQQMRSATVPLTYLDNAASSQKPQSVIDTLNTYYRTQNANVHRGIHWLSEMATELYEGARVKLQKFVNAKTRREIIFTRGTTEAINLVAQTWGRANLKAGDVVLSTVMEHHANIVSWQIAAEQYGFTLRYVPLLYDGTLDQAAYARLLREENVKLVALTHGSNTLGTINPVADMIQLAHAHGALVLVDAAQTAPHFKLDVQALDCDFLAFSGHKMLGPTGIGVLYGKRELLEAMPPFLGGGDMIATVTLEGSTWNQLPYKFEAGTPAIAQAIGLGAAVDYLNALDLPAANVHEHALFVELYERLSEIAGVRVLGAAPERGALAAFTMEGAHAHDIAQVLDQHGVAVRAGHHCTMPLHQHLGIAASVRASLYFYNTAADVDRFIQAVYAARKTLVS